MSVVMLLVATTQNLVLLKFLSVKIEFLSVTESQTLVFFLFPLFVPLKLSDKIPETYPKCNIPMKTINLFLCYFIV